MGKIWENWAVLGFSTLSIVAGMVAAWSSSASFEHKLALTVAALMGLGALVLAGRRVRQAEDKLVPRFEIRLPEAEDQSRTHVRIANDGTTFIIRFLGIDILNTSPEPIRNVEVDVLEFVRPNGTRWTGRAALNFAPRANPSDPSQKEPINRIPSLKQNIPETACICSIDHKGMIYFGSFSWNWRDSWHFHEEMKDRGKYAFTIAISAEDGSASRRLNLMVIWTGDMTTSRIEPAE